MYKFVKDKQTVAEKGEGEVWWERREINRQYLTNFSQRGLPKCMQIFLCMANCHIVSKVCVINGAAHRGYSPRPVN